MRRAAIIVATLLLALAATAQEKPATISGVVLHENSPLPGTTVRVLEAGREIATATTDTNGRYSLSGVPRGYYDLVTSMEGMQSVFHEIYVGEGELLVAEPVSLELMILEDPIMTSCGSPCDGEGEPTCEDYERNRELEDSAARDSGAIDQLRERYRRTDSREERARIAGFLVSILDNDDEYFAPLAASTEMLLSFAERSGEHLNIETPEYAAWCDSTGRDRKEELWALEAEAFALFGSPDPRVVWFAHRALRVDEPAIIYGAIAYTGLTCDESLLAAIDEDFEALAEDMGVHSLVELVPCGDTLLNERILALDEEEAALMLPSVIEVRNAELARLGKSSDGR
jgi:hypothetical protein